MIRRIEPRDRHRHHSMTLLLTQLLQQPQRLLDGRPQLAELLPVGSILGRDRLPQTVDVPPEQGDLRVGPVYDRLLRPETLLEHTESRLDPRQHQPCRAGRQLSDGGDRPLQSFFRAKCGTVLR
jgi:hypothetical protein